MPLLGAFGDGRDVYSEFASTIYDHEVTKADKLERFVGKTAILGLGYGCGPAKFRHMLYIGNGGVSLRVELEEAEKIVLAYRQTYPEIPDLWAACNSMLLHMFNGTPQRRDTLIKHLPITLGEDHIVLPNGLTMKYPNLGFTFTEEGREVCYDDPYGGRRKIYGAKAVENLSQALSRIVITDIALAIHSTTGRHPFLSTHDSLDYCVPASEALDLDTELTRQFAQRPRWAPDLPLASEGGWGKTLDGAEMGYNE
jgi:DNA polymerase